MEREEFIKSVAQDFRDNNKSLYFGAGLSKNFDLPDWNEIFKKLCVSLQKKYPDLNNVNTKDSDCYAVGQYIENIIGDRTIILDEVEKILRYSSTLNGTQESLYNYLTLQEYNSVWTTNFDGLYESISKKKYYNYNVVDLSSGIKNYHELKQKRTLYKINGSITDPNRKIILTKDDFEKYGELNKTFASLLKRELICNTFLFIGCSFSDGILRPILRELKQVFGDNFRHYAIFIKNNDDKNQIFALKDLEKRYGIYSYVIDVNDKKKITQDIVSLLKMIYQQSINRNVFISGSIYDPEDNDEHRSFIKKLVYSLYDNGYRIVGGVGKKLSYYIGGATTKYMEERRETDITKYLDQLNFYLDDNADKTREKMINRARHSLFVYCHGFESEEQMKSSGTFKELDISLKNRNTIIPIVNKSSGNGMYSIYSTINSEIKNTMQRCKNDDDIIREILKILDDRQSIIEGND